MLKKEGWLSWVWLGLGKDNFSFFNGIGPGCRVLALLWHRMDYVDRLQWLTRAVFCRSDPLTLGAVDDWDPWVWAGHLCLFLEMGKYELGADPCLWCS